MSSRSRDDVLTDLPEVRLGFAEAALLVTVVGCEQLGLAGPAGLTVLAAVTALSCLVLPLRFSAVVAVSAWAFLTGFVVHTGGQLSLHTADLTRLGVLASVVVAASPLEWLSRRARVAVAHGRARPAGAPHA